MAASKSQIHPEMNVEEFNTLFSKGEHLGYQAYCSKLPPNASKVESTGYDYGTGRAMFHKGIASILIGVVFIVVALAVQQLGLLIPGIIIIVPALLLAFFGYSIQRNAQGAKEQLLRQLKEKNPV